MSKEFTGKTDKKEKWYGTDYATEPFSEALLKVKLVIFVFNCTV